MTDWAAFFRLHEGLDRQGPGLPDDVRWAVDQADAHDAARVFDAGCGAGADIPALLEACPDATILAVDTHGAFVRRVADRFAETGRVDAQESRMETVDGPFDFVWCAGAIYFLGVTEGLRAFAPKLGKGAAVAFSEPVWTVDDPPEGARENWADYPSMTDLPGLEARVAKAGFEVVASRLLSHEAWAAYYDPMAVRVDEMRRTPQLDPGMEAVLAEAQREIAAWRDHGDAFTYALLVARPS